MFEKWEGLGNDFLVVEAASCSWLSPDHVRFLCDRRRGVGADGVLLVSRVPARMAVVNADGSRPEMCGNGLRCVAGYLASSTAPMTMAIQTDAGQKICKIQQQTSSDSVDVEVEMGSARVLGEIQVSNGPQTLCFTQVDVGNPHAIVYGADMPDEAAVDAWGPLVSSAIPGGSNVEFCCLRPSQDPVEIDVLVWERGVGRTQACGTGACAVAACACFSKRAPFDRPIAVHLPGGTLWIRVSEQLQTLTMRGPARRVFSGEVIVP